MKDANITRLDTLLDIDRPRLTRDDLFQIRASIEKRGVDVARILTPPFGEDLSAIVGLSSGSVELVREALAREVGAIFSVIPFIDAERSRLERRERFADPFFDPLSEYGMIAIGDRLREIGFSSEFEVPDTIYQKLLVEYSSDDVVCVFGMAGSGRLSLTFYRTTRARFDDGVPEDDEQILRLPDVRSILEVERACEVATCFGRLRPRPAEIMSDDLPFDTTRPEDEISF